MTIALEKTANKIVARFKPEERVELADILYATLPRKFQAQVEKAWEKEIDRRLDEYESGTVKTIPSAVVHSGIRGRLNEIKARRISTRRVA